jgi:hypothetical protein
MLAAKINNHSISLCPKETGAYRAAWIPGRDVYDAKSTGMISDLVKKLNQLEPTDWTEAMAVYKIVR